MSYRNSNFIKRLKSLTVLTVGGTSAFACISLYRNDENFYKNVFLPAVCYVFEPERAHRFAILLAKWKLVPHSRFNDTAVLGTQIWGLKFRNPIGIAAGFDKDGEAVSGLFRTGIGFLEVGSVTPLPQEGNPKPRMFRLEEDEAVINRCGFNNKGHDYVKSHLQFFDKANGVLGVNLGKNKLSPSPTSDYVLGIQEFYRIADYLVINVSSPNTPGLRSLQKLRPLEELLDEVIEARKSACSKLLAIDIQNPANLDDSDVTIGSQRFPPILVKIAPDLSYEEKKDIAKVVMRKGKKVDGLIISNTTVSRPDDLISEHKSQTGGLSGKPLKNLSTQAIKDMYELTKGELPIIGVGGVSCGQDAYEKICAGASLIQVYTALVYGGPPVIDKIKRELRDLLIADGYSNVSEAVGTCHKKR